MIRIIERMSTSSTGLAITHRKDRMSHLPLVSVVRRLDQRGLDCHSRAIKMSSAQLSDRSCQSQQKWSGRQMLSVNNQRQNGDKAVTQIQNRGVLEIHS